MTFEEAKKILKKEGFHLVLASKVINQTGAIREFEKPEVCEAIKVANANKWAVGLSPIEWDEREARLKKEYEKNTKAPGPGEAQPKEKKGFIYPKTFPKTDFFNDAYPALKEAASQFNDALLDEQAKKIEELTKENEDWKSWHELQNRAIAINNIVFRDEKNRLGKEIARLNGIIHNKNEELKRKTKGCCELVAESVGLKEALSKTESLLHDAREANSKNLDSCFKNEDIIDDLKKKLAEKTKLAKKYAKELEDSSLGLCKLVKKLKDKNAILSDVAEELRLTKIREKNLAELGLKYVGENENLKKELADKVVDKIDAQALKSAESALAYKEKVIAEKDEVIADFGNELAEAKKLNTAKILDFNAKCMKAARESINEVFESYAAKYAKSSLDELKEKAYESFNAKAHSLGLVGSKDGNGLLNQMAGIDIAEEGGDRSAAIVECGKDIIDLFNEIKRLWQ